MTSTNTASPAAQHDPCTPPPFLIALTGPTSSGKTTIATALADILSPFVDFTMIHADDFYRPDGEIPLNKDGVQDWDCAGSLDMPKFRQTLLQAKDGVGLPEGNFEDGAHGSKGIITTPTIEQAKQEIEAWPQRLLKKMNRRPIVLVDGFLLIGESVRETLAPLFDLKILLRATFTAARARRARRNGYITLQGFWKDPPGYFEHVVWPNYVREHAWLFEDGDVEGEGEGNDNLVKPKELDDGGGGRDYKGNRHDVRVGPVGEDISPEETLGWVLGVVRCALEGAEGGLVQGGGERGA
ncbi:MAG: hypothetical protein Q9217_001824 [Psora testacea]